jgi:hypothetical protein
VIFKAYDVRGVYPEELNEDAAFRIGRAFSGWSRADRIIVGRDCRLSSPSLSEAFVDGVTGRGTGVLDIGLATTDMVYFASGRLSMPGAMVTASHNPARYNSRRRPPSGRTPGSPRSRPSPKATEAGLLVPFAATWRQGRCSVPTSSTCCPSRTSSGSLP